MHQHYYVAAVVLSALAVVLVLTDWYVVRRMVNKGPECVSSVEIHRTLLDKFFITYLLAISAVDGIMLVHGVYDFSIMLSIIIAFVELSFLKSKL